MPRVALRAMTEPRTMTAIPGARTGLLLLGGEKSGGGDAEMDL